jgi:hypothetical protein
MATIDLESRLSALRAQGYDLRITYTHDGVVVASASSSGRPVCVRSDHMQATYRSPLDAITRALVKLTEFTLDEGEGGAPSP